jgi:hypothetical protein
MEAFPPGDAWAVHCAGVEDRLDRAGRVRTQLGAAEDVERPELPSRQRPRLGCTRHVPMGPSRPAPEVVDRGIACVPIKGRCHGPLMGTGGAIDRLPCRGKAALYGVFPWDRRFRSGVPWLCPTPQVPGRRRRSRPHHTPTELTVPMRVASMRRPKGAPPVCPSLASQIPRRLGRCTQLYPCLLPRSPDPSLCYCAQDLESPAADPDRGRRSFGYVCDASLLSQCRSAPRVAAALACVLQKRLLLAG